MQKPDAVTEWRTHGGRLLCPFDENEFQQVDEQKRSTKEAHTAKRFACSLFGIDCATKIFDLLFGTELGVDRIQSRDEAYFLDRTEHEKRFNWLN